MSKSINDSYVAGGVVANVKLNQSLSQGLGANSFFAFPNMGDGGLCGAAQAVLGTKSEPLKDVYL